MPVGPALSGQPFASSRRKPRFVPTSQAPSRSATIGACSSVGKSPISASHAYANGASAFARATKPKPGRRIAIAPSDDDSRPSTIPRESGACARATPDAPLKAAKRSSAGARMPLRAKQDVTPQRPTGPAVGFALPAGFGSVTPICTQLGSMIAAPLA